MGIMTKKRRADGPDDAAPKRYPSRNRTKYLAVPIHIYQAVEEYAASCSGPDDKRSVSWAARQLLRKALTDLGREIPPPPPVESED